MFYQLTAAHAAFMLAAIMEWQNVSRDSSDVLHPAVATPPASGASRPGCTGGSVRLDDFRLRAWRGRYPDLPALSPRTGLAGHVERPGQVDRRPRASRRRAARLNRQPPRPQRSWPAMPLRSPPWPAFVWAWVGLLAGTLGLAWPGGPAAWPARDRPRPSAPAAVRPRLEDRDLEADHPSALMRRTTAARGRPPAIIDGHAAITPTHRWP